MSASAAAIQLEVVSRVGCKWCDRLKAWLRRHQAGAANESVPVVWHESAVLDPQAAGYAEQRDALLERAAHAQSTFPFVFNTTTGRLVGGHDATLATIEAAKVLAAMDEGGF
jgi:hypothetical protein